MIEEEKLKPGAWVVFINPIFYGRNVSKWPLEIIAVGKRIKVGTERGYKLFDRKDIVAVYDTKVEAEVASLAAWSVQQQYQGTIKKVEDALAALKAESYREQAKAARMGRE